MVWMDMQVLIPAPRVGVCVLRSPSAARGRVRTRPGPACAVGVARRVPPERRAQACARALREDPPRPAPGPSGSHPGVPPSGLLFRSAASASAKGCQPLAQSGTQRWRAPSRRGGACGSGRVQPSGGAAGVSPWRRMTSPISARSGGPPADAAKTAATSRKYSGPSNPGVMTQSAFASTSPWLSKWCTAPRRMHNASPAATSTAAGGLYAKRQGMIEPIFAQTKFNRRCDRFQRRGRAACRSEWRLITATHNLLKLHTHLAAAAGA